MFQNLLLCLYVLFRYFSQWPWVLGVWKQLSCSQFLALLFQTQAWFWGLMQLFPRPGGTVVPSQALVSYSAPKEDEPVWCLDETTLALKLACLPSWPPPVSCVWPTFWPPSLCWCKPSPSYSLLVSPTQKRKIWVNPRKRLMVCDIPNLDKK